MRSCGAVFGYSSRLRCSSILARLIAGLGLLLTLPVQGEFTSGSAISSLPFSPAFVLDPVALRNDCGLRAVGFILADRGLDPELQELASLLSHRYIATEGIPAGEGYSLSDLQWLLAYFGIPSRGLSASRSWLENIDRVTILRMPGKVGGHFIVLEPRDALGLATIYDPSHGILKVPWDGLVSRWSDPMGRGIALIIESTSHASHQGRP
jgi:hypothetical protein